MKQIQYLLLPLLLLMVGRLAIAQTELTTLPSQDKAATQSAEEVHSKEGSEPAASAPDQPQSASQRFGLFTLLPALVAIVLAVFTRQVIPSLVVAILVGAYMVQCAPPVGVQEQFGDTIGIVRGIRIAVEGYTVGAITQSERVQILLFTLLIGGMVGVMAASGGTRAMVQIVSRWARNPKRGQLMGWLAGLVVFFDDYANSMIVGPTLAPIYDRLRISRQKLAYIVDSTAAPVASLALIGTWIGLEIGYIQQGLDSLGSQAPEFLADTNAYQIFLYSIPYRFYAIFALLLVVILAMTERDYGPMKRAQRRAQSEFDSQLSALQEAALSNAKWWYAGYPIILLVVLTLGILLYTGWAGASWENASQGGFWWKLGELLRNADAYASILYGAFFALVLALVIGLVTKSLYLKRGVDAALDGMTRMFPSLVILVLAWALSQIMLDLELAQVATRYLGSENLDVDPSYLPLIVFVTSALVSFATGTSWGTMGIMCPVVVQVSAQMVPGGVEGTSLFYASVGSVLAGAVFGDHCSPISDTTVLSALASGCSLESHVWTQLPYALTAAVVAMCCGDLLCSHFNQPWYLGLLCGVVMLVLIVLAVGRKTAPVTSNID